MSVRVGTAVVGPPAAPGRTLDLPLDVSGARGSPSGSAGAPSTRQRSVAAKGINHANGTLHVLDWMYGRSVSPRRFHRSKSTSARSAPTRGAKASATVRDRVARNAEKAIHDRNLVCQGQTNVMSVVRRT